MSEHMLSETEWSRNVGTQSFPVSFLHEYAVGLLWDRLNGRDPVSVKTMDGSQSRDLREGAVRVVIPDSMQPIGGCIPDLAVLDKDLRPIRVIEVVVTSPPSGEKREKLERLNERGVEVVLVPVRNENELRALVPTATDGKRISWAYGWSPTVFEQMGVVNIPRQRQILKSQREASTTVTALINSLIQCGPETRRKLLQVLQEMENLEARYPLSPNNPKRAVVSGNQVED